jgi:N-methylhydantoinase A
MSDRLPAGGVYRVGVDIGGTFTDLILLGPDGATTAAKVPTSEGDYGAAIVDGLRQLFARRGLMGGDLGAVLHATTLASNMILERRGARTALVTTAGFRDVLEIGRGRLPRLYDVQWSKPVPLVERSLRFELGGRLDAQGEEIRPLDQAALSNLIEQLREARIEAIAVCFINSYANPDHEREVGAALAQALGDGVTISLSADVLPEIKEYERTSTTVINAYLTPGVRHYLGRLNDQLKALGVVAPVRVMQSNGGLTTGEAAVTHPVTIIESGPAAGVIGAIAIGRRLGIDNLITLDMGGTTAKAAMIEHGEAGRAAEFEVGGSIIAGHRLIRGAGYIVRSPVIDVAEIGAGGGSIIWVDEGGSPRVGPRSAGAVPGPACYSAGGAHPTVTDANLLLGYLGADSLVGGTLRVDPERAQRALAEHVAGPLGLDLTTAAWGAHAIANANMLRALRAVSTERGRDPRDFVLVAFGGNGPVHAVQLARALGSKRVLVPPHPGVFSALGLLMAAVEHHGVQTIPRGPRRADPATLSEYAARLVAAGEANLVAQGFPPDAISTRVHVDMRYLGQSSELTITVPRGDPASALAQLRIAFDAEHQRTFGHSSDDPIEVVSVRVVATVDGDVDATLSSAMPTPLQHGERSVYFGDRHAWLQTPIIGRDQLDREWQRGPLIVEEYDATTVIPPGARVRLGEQAMIEIEVEIS